MYDLGREMHELCRELFPICRSITGEGNRKTLAIIKKHVPLLNIKEVRSGTRCFDWTVPKEWNIRDAYIIDPEGRKIASFKDSNLHVMGYSVPVDKEVSLEELAGHLHSIPDQPKAIPYVTSYYKEEWGFCIPHELRSRLGPGRYKAYIDSDLREGSLTYGELILKGRTEKEVFLSTYICHPSMANNELSGPVVTAYLSKWLAAKKDRKYTYRIILIPETIGSIAYLSLNLEAMKKNIVAGFNVTCVGDERAYSYLPSRDGSTLADRAAKHVLRNTDPGYKPYSYLQRGSDERQYCSPGIDLPVCSVMRSKYGEYPEYHTSLDDLEFVTPAGLAGGYEALKRCIECIEKNETLKVSVLCEPQMGKRGMYPSISKKDSAEGVRNMMNLLAYSDGKRTLLETADLIGVPMWELQGIAEKLKTEGLLKEA